MKERLLSRTETASLCRELALLLHAGVEPGDAVALLREEAPEGRARQVLSDMAVRVDEGVSLPAAMEAAGAFPACRHAAASVPAACPDRAQVFITRLEKNTLRSTPMMRLPMRL